MTVAHLNYKKVLENALPDPNASLREMRLGGMVAAVCAVVMLVIWPYYPPVSVVVIAGSLSLAWWARKKEQEIARDEQELLKVRWNKVSEIPIHEEDASDWKHDEKNGFQNKPGDPLRATYWFMYGCPHRKRYQAETIHEGGTTRRAARIRREVVQEHLPQLHAIRKHVRTHHRSVYDTVEEWWEIHVRDQIFRSIYLDRDASWDQLEESEQKAIQAKGLAEFFEGIMVAVRPDRWRVKYDSRPTHVHISELRLLLIARFGEEGTYPNEDQLKEVPRIRLQKRKWVYIGEGARWGKEEAQKYEYETYRDINEIPGMRDQQVRGDTRLMGLMWRKIRPQFLSYKIYTEHTLITGGSGKGKTCGVQTPLVNSIISGGANLTIDPKSDMELQTIVTYYACLVGREDDLQYLNLVDTENVANCSYSPAHGVNGPNEYGGRLGSFFPSDAGQNQFFVDESKRVGRIAMSLCYYINKYMALVGDLNEASTRPPILLLWLAFCEAKGVSGDAGSAAIEKAKAEFLELHRKMITQGSLFRASEDWQKDLEVIWHSRWFKPENWIPSFIHVKLFSSQRPWRLVTWTLRLVFPHIMAETEWRDPEFALRDERGQVIKEGSAQDEDGEDKPVLVSLLNLKRVHPLESAAATTDKLYMRKWRALYEAFVPRDRVEKIRYILRDLNESLEEHIQVSQTDLETYKKHTGSLDAPVSLITSGAVGRILAEPNPVITIERIHKEKKLTYIMSGQTVDGDTSDAVCKSLTKTILSYGGLKNSRGKVDLDILVVGDEMPAWVSREWSDVIDKLRSVGLRTLNMSQSLAGILSRMGNEHMVNHIYASMTTRIQYQTQDPKDAERFVDALEKVKIFKPQRSTNENPSLGKTGATTTAGQFGSGESWTFVPEDIPLVTKDCITRLPVGQCFIKQEEKLYLIVAGKVEVPGAISWMLQCGLKNDDDPDDGFVELDGERLPIEIHGVHYHRVKAVELSEDWGTAASQDHLRQHAASARVTAEEIDAIHVPLDKSPKGFVDLSDLLGTFTNHDDAAGDESQLEVIEDIPHRDDAYLINGKEVEVEADPAAIASNRGQGTSLGSLIGSALEEEEDT